MIGLPIINSILIKLKLKIILGNGLYKVMYQVVKMEEDGQDNFSSQVKLLLNIEKIQQYILKNLEKNLENNFLN